MAMEPASRWIDRRNSPRRTIQQAGEIISPGGARFKCVIHDLSDTGANIEVHGLVPKEFQLLLYWEETRRCCRVVWRHGVRIGVQFQ